MLQKAERGYCNTYQRKSPRLSIPQLFGVPIGSVKEDKKELQSNLTNP
jgi:hypothetical protein